LLTELPYPSSVPGQYKYMFSMVVTTLLNDIPTGDMYLDVVKHFEGTESAGPKTFFSWHIPGVVLSQAEWIQWNQAGDKIVRIYAVHNDDIQPPYTPTEPASECEDDDAAIQAWFGPTNCANMASFGLCEQSMPDGSGLVSDACGCACGSGAGADDSERLQRRFLTPQ